jgi:hypothetical protein
VIALAKVKIARRVRVVLDLDDITHALLVATCRHTGKGEAELVGDALRVLFVALPRVEDGEACARDASQAGMKETPARCQAPGRDRGREATPMDQRVQSRARRQEGDMNRDASADATESDDLIGSCRASLDRELAAAEAAGAVDPVVFLMHKSGRTKVFVKARADMLSFLDASGAARAALMFRASPSEPGYRTVLTLIDDAMVTGRMSRGSA